METNKRERQNDQMPFTVGDLFAGGGERYFLPLDKPVLARDTLGRVLKITCLSETDENTLLFVAEIVQRKDSDGTPCMAEEALCTK